MSVDSLITAAKIGGIPLVCLVLLFLLAKFVGGRFVKTLDQVAARSEAHALQITLSVTTAMREIANSVTQSATANVHALSMLTDRVSRMEGVVAGLGLAAVREHRAAAHEWDDEGVTPLEVPAVRDKSKPVQRIALIPSPPPRPGTVYSHRPATEPGKEKKK